MKHYKVPELVAINIETFGLDESKLTEQDCVNEADHELEVMQAWESDGYGSDVYGEDYGRLRRQLTSYLTRQRKRGITPTRKYGYISDPAKQLK